MLPSSPPSSAPALLRPILAAVLLAMLLAIGARLELTMAVSRLVPEQGEVAEAMAAADRFGMADTALIEVDGSGADRATLLSAVDELGARLAARDDIADVRYRLGVAELQGLAKLRPRAVELVPEDALAVRLSAEGLDQLFQGWIVKLSGPGGGLFRRSFADDPLDLLSLAMDQLRTADQPFDIQVEQGHMLDRSGTRGLLVLRPKPHALSMGPDDPFVASIEAELAATALPARWYGGHRIAAASATAIHDGVVLAAGVGVAALGLVLLVGFGGLRPLLGLLLPLSLALGALLAAAGLRSPVHGATLGFASALLGSAVDYWIHLYVRCAGRDGARGDGALRDGAGGADTARADSFSARHGVALVALRRILPALLLSAGSTGGVFLLLFLSGSPVVADLGLMGAMATAGALGGVVLLGPLAYGLVGGRLARWRLPDAPRGLGAFVLLFGLLAAVLLPMAHLDGDPRNLVQADAVTRALGEELDRRYGGLGLGGVVLVEGGAAGLDGALERAEPLTAALSELPGVAVTSPTLLLPSAHTRAARLAALPDPAVLQPRIDAAATAAGFRPEAVADVATRLDAERLAVFGSAVTPGQDAGKGSLAPFDADAWAGTPFATIVDRHVNGDDVMLSLGLSDEQAASQVEATVQRLDRDARLLLPSQLSAHGVRSMLAELLRLGGLAVGGVLLLLATRYRRPRRLLAALAPAALGMLLAGAATVVAGQPLNVVSIAGLVLVLGLGLDYGVFMVELDAEGERPGRAIALSSATTAGGFAPLLLTGVPALSGLGLVVLVGVSGAALAALSLSPALASGRRLAGARLLRGLALSLLALLNLDLLLQQVMWLTPPTPPAGFSPPDTAVTEPALGERLLRDQHLVHSHDIAVLSLTGDAYSRGFGLGALTPDMNRRLEAHLRGELERQVPIALFRGLIERGTVLLAPRLDRFFTAEQRLELQGAVDGRRWASGPDDFDRDAPPYTRKVYFHAIHDVGQALVDTPFVAACTGFAAGGPATTDGHWLLGRNFDFEGGAIFDREKLLWVVRPDEGIPYVSVGFAGSIGVVTGVNAEGLAISLQAGGSDAPPRPGTPMTLIAREILEQARSLDEAEQILQQRTGFVSENVLVVDGRAGAAAVFEVGPAGMARLPVPDSGWLGVANHFRAERWADDAVNQQRMAELTTVARQDRMDELLARDAGRIDLDVGVQILRDKRGVGDRPLAPGHRQAIDAFLASHSAVIDATAGVIRVSRAPNTSGGYVEWSLDRLFAGDLEGDLVVEEEGRAAALAVARGRELLRQARHADGVDALQLAQAALEVMPTHPEAHLAMARALAALDRGDDALPHVDAALAGPPEYARQVAELRALRAELAP